MGQEIQVFRKTSQTAIPALILHIEGHHSIISYDYYNDNKLFYNNDTAIPVLEYHGTMVQLYR